MADVDCKKIQSDLGPRLISLSHLVEDTDDVVEADEVPVLVVAHLPGRLVGELHVRWHGDRLPEVDQPDVGRVVCASLLRGRIFFARISVTK